MNRKWYQVSLRALLLLMLLVGTFFAGRYSLRQELERLRRDADQARREADAARQQAVVAAHTIFMLTAPTSANLSAKAEAIEKGMKAGEQELRREMEFRMQNERIFFQLPER